MPGSSSERAEQVKNFARGEIDKYSRGEITVVPTWQKVADLFGYRGGNSAPREVVLKAGLIDKWREIQMNTGRRSGLKVPEDQTEKLTPSRNLAWMIGVLSCQGYVEPIGDAFSVDSVDTQFLEAFKSTGEELFKINGQWRFKRGVRKGVIFYSKSIVRKLGDLRKTQWPNTIRNSHTWILNNSHFGWAFLQGAFDRVGHINDLETSHDYRADLSTDDLMCANFLADLLVRLGVENPRLDYEKQGNERVRLKGITVERVNDIRKIALNIHSAIAIKEQRLELYRQTKIKGRKPPSIGE